MSLEVCPECGEECLLSFHRCSPEIRCGKCNRLTREWRWQRVGSGLRGGSVGMMLCEVCCREEER
jgi:ribosomal protein S27AE